MKNGKLILEGKNWKIASPDFKQPMSIAGNFGFTDDMANQNIEFDNSGGAVKKIRFNGKNYTPKIGYSQPKGNVNQKDYSENKKNDQTYQNSTIMTNDPARAPYNFVPLNENVIVSNGSANFSRFEAQNGYIDVQIISQSPLFIRGANEVFVNNNNLPYIPGSSLRGMIRNLVNIASFGKLNQFNDRTLFRRSSMLSDGKFVNAGFLKYENGIYFIDEAIAIQSTSDYRLSREPHLYQFDDKTNTCKFSVGEFQNICRVWVFTKKTGKIDVLGNAIKGYEADDTRSKEAIDLLKSLKEKKIVDGNNNPIGSVNIPARLGIPVFYRVENKIAISFGHAKYHRIPYSQTIGDHIIQENKNEPDFSESIFGTLDQPSKVFFEDCCLIGEPVYDLSEAQIPKVLSSPKPTTYQHYLEQPDINTSPSHQNKWSTDGVPIKGYKNYWHRETSSNEEGPNTWIEIGDKSNSNPEPINPISKKSIFKGRIRFENLTNEELGALLFAIELPEGCCHKLGMGKPLGLGSVLISIDKLSIIDRAERYKTLLNSDSWEQGVKVEIQNTDSIKNDFVKFIYPQLENGQYDSSKGFMSLWENDRLMKLREMLTFLHNTNNALVNWKNRTRYMENGAGNNGVNEFKYRPVLPTPDIVVIKNTYKNT